MFAFDLSRSNSGPNSPGAAGPEGASSARRAKKPASGAVLVVDDEPLIRWSLRKGLTKSGYDVVEAGSAAQALDAITTDPRPFDVVILDYRLPDRRDLSLLMQVRHLLPNAAVLMMTAYGEDEMRTQALALGVCAVVDKPFQVARFVALVDQVCSH